MNKYKFTSALSFSFLLLLFTQIVIAEPLNITVYGASGRIGSRVVEVALDRGHHVTGVTRNIARLEGNHKGLKVVKGDIFSIESIKEITNDQDVVINMIGDTSNVKDAQHHSIYRSAQTLTEAFRQMKNAPRLIALTGAATLEVEPGVLMIETFDMPADDKRFINIQGHKNAYDYYLTVTDVNWSIATPSRHLAPGLRTGQYRVAGHKVLRNEKGEYASISMEDFAIAIINEAERGRNIHKQFTVGY